MFDYGQCSGVIRQIRIHKIWHIVSVSTENVVSNPYVRFAVCFYIRMIIYIPQNNKSILRLVFLSPDSYKYYGHLLNIPNAEDLLKKKEISEFYLSII